MSSTPQIVSRLPGPATRWGRRIGLAMIVGVAAGAAAAVLDQAIHAGSRHLIGRFTHLGTADFLHFEWAILLMPAVGGLVSGLILFLVLLLRTYIRIVRLRPQADDATTSLLLDWALVIIPAVLVAGLTGAILDAYPTNLIFWAVLGAASRAIPPPTVDGPGQNVGQQ